MGAVVGAWHVEVSSGPAPTMGMAVELTAWCVGSRCFGAPGDDAGVLAGGTEPKQGSAFKVCTQ